MGCATQKLGAICQWITQRPQTFLHWLLTRNTWRHSVHVLRGGRDCSLSSEVHMGRKSADVKLRSKCVYAEDRESLCIITYWHRHLEMRPVLPFQSPCSIQTAVILPLDKNQTRYFAKTGTTCKNTKCCLDAQGKPRPTLNSERSYRTARGLLKLL